MNSNAKQLQFKLLGTAIRGDMMAGCVLKD